MTDQPRIFVSAVSCEFASATKQIAAVLTRLGCEPVLCEINGNEPDDSRSILRKKIRSCDGLIQVVGDAYGPEPAVPDQKLGRVSYAQFEYLFARQKRKKIWLIFAGLGAIADFNESRFDKPPDPDHSDPEGYQLERQVLQAEYRERLQAESTPSVEAANESEIRSQVEQLKDELDHLRTARVWRRLRRKQVMTVVPILLAAAAISGGVWAAIRTYNNRLVGTAAEALDPNLIRSHLEQAIRTTYGRQTAEARKAADAETQRRALGQADLARDQELGQLEPTIAFIRETIVRGEASPEFLEMSRLLQEQSVDAALVYLASQEPRLLGDADHWKTMPPREVRRALAPLLGESVLLRQRGDLPAAGRLCERLLINDSDWPDARFQQAMVMMALGERALLDERPTAAWERFGSAGRSADRLVQYQQTDPLWPSHLSRLYCRLAALNQQAGRPEESRELSMKRLECAKKWVAAEPKSVAAQRELSDVLVKIGELNVYRGQFKLAEEFYAQGVEITNRLVAAGLQADHDLSIVYVNIGDVWTQLGILKTAKKYYERSLSIQKQLAAANPADQDLQAQLARSFERLAAADKQAAGELYQKALEVRSSLAAVRPADAASQRELSAAFERLANVSPSDFSAELYRKSLAIRKTLAETNRTNAEAQRDLLVTYKKTAAAYIRCGRFDQAGAVYDQELGYVKGLAAADPANSEIQMRLSDLYDDMGNACQQAGQFEPARNFYQQSLDIRSRAANARPADEGALVDLGKSYRQLARLAETVGNIEGAIQICERGIAKFEDLGKTPSLQAQMHRHLVQLQNQYAQCNESRDIAGALEPVLKRRRERLPFLLRRRCRLLAARKDIQGVAQTAAALRDLKPRTASNLYDAARGYGLCAKLAAGWSGAGPFQSAHVKADQDPTEWQKRTAEQRKFRQTAIDLLQQAVSAGYLQMRWAPQDQDLAALYELPEFKTLVSRSPKTRRPFAGG